MYNTVRNNHGNHITMSYKIHKYEIITKHVHMGIISLYLDLNGRAMTYYLGTIIIFVHV